jgi:hypothetical protein
MREPGDYAGFESHEDFRRRPKADHARQSSFWTCIAKLTG